MPQAAPRGSTGQLPTRNHHRGSSPGQPTTPRYSRGRRDASDDADFGRSGSPLRRDRSQSVMRSRRPDKKPSRHGDRERGSQTDSVRRPRHSRRQSHDERPGRPGRHGGDSPSLSRARSGSGLSKRSLLGKRRSSPSPERPVPHKNDLEVLMRVGQTALEAGALAAYRSWHEPGPWIGPKGARVATAVLGTALVDGLIDKKFPNTKGGMRHQAARRVAQVAIGNLLTQTAGKKGQQKFHK